MSAQDRLDRICAELEIDRPAARSFVADYLALLDQRLARIEHELDALLAADPSPGQPATADGVAADGPALDGPALDGAALDGADPDGAIVALLSLDASSTMIGAYELSLAARRLRVEVQTGRRAAIGQYRQELRRAAERTETQLGELSA